MVGFELDRVDPDSQAEKKVTVDGNQSTLSFGDFKKALGAGISRYNDEQIEQFWVTFDIIADVVFDDWLSRKNAHNVGV